jgi:hypothetical protein
MRLRLAQKWLLWLNIREFIFTLALAPLRLLLFRLLLFTEKVADFTKESLFVLFDLRFLGRLVCFY